MNMEDKFWSHDFEDESESSSASAAATKDQGWQKVTYPKRNQRRRSPSSATDLGRPNVLHPQSNVFDSVENKAQERRRALEFAAASAAANDAEHIVTRSRTAATSDDDDDGSGAEAPAVENGEAKKVKKKKPKKPKITVAEASSKIDAMDLSAFIAEISVSFETQHDIQLMRFADYFARAFAAVAASQFPWTKMFKESSIAKLTDDFFPPSQGTVETR